MSIHPNEIGSTIHSEFEGPLGRQDLLSQEFTGPRFRFVCPAGCPVGNEAQCRRVLRTAITDATRLADHAARRLNQPRTDATTRIFQGVFGHPPNRAVAWGGGRDSGAIVAVRFQAAARSLHGRGTLYRCSPPPPLHPLANARTVNPAEVLIFPRFWRQEPSLPVGSKRNRDLRAGTILHEMMHQYFIGFIRHIPATERRRNNAHCFEVFAMRASGISPHPSDVAQCRSQPP